MAVSMPSSGECAVHQTLASGVKVFNTRFFSMAHSCPPYSPERPHRARIATCLVLLRFMISEEALMGGR